MEETAALTLVERVKDALANGKDFITDEVELDGLKYAFYGVLIPEGENYLVQWSGAGIATKYTGQQDTGVGRITHAGQQDMIGFHGDFDFSNHNHCPTCEEDCETEYAQEEFGREGELIWYKVEWDPTLTF